VNFIDVTCEDRWVWRRAFSEDRGAGTLISWSSAWAVAGLFQSTGMKEHAIPFKYLSDAMRLRYEAVRALEEADIQTNSQEKRRLLTFVVAGGGFSGVECIAELHDFLVHAVSAYHNLTRQDLRCVLLQSGERILPEVDPVLASYAIASSRSAASISG